MSYSDPRGRWQFGWLLKKGEGRHSWKRRFFQLNDRTLSYFKGERDHDPIGHISILVSPAPPGTLSGMILEGQLTAVCPRPIFPDFVSDIYCGISADFSLPCSGFFFSSSLLSLQVLAGP